jgi:hypothetical protein
MRVVDRNKLFKDVPGVGSSGLEEIMMQAQEAKKK